MLPSCFIIFSATLVRTSLRWTKMDILCGMSCVGTLLQRTRHRTHTNHTPYYRGYIDCAVVADVVSIISAYANPSREEIAVFSDTLAACPLAVVRPVLHIRSVWVHPCCLLALAQEKHLLHGTDVLAARLQLDCSAASCIIADVQNIIIDYLSAETPADLLLLLSFEDLCSASVHGVFASSRHVSS
jgi:hypothetical protein